jgi:hypothetical protein
MHSHMCAHSKQLLTAKANTICATFVTEEAKKQVNIISAIRNRLLASLKAGQVTATLFSEAEAQILSLLASDSFNRFKLSDNFPEMLVRQSIFFFLFFFLVSFFFSFFSRSSAPLHSNRRKSWIATL